MVGDEVIEVMVGKLRAVRCLMCLSGVVLMTATLAQAQVANFTIAWSPLGEVAASAERPARAGKQLFTAADLAELSLQKVTVARIDVDPSIVNLRTGERFCLSALQVRAMSDQRALVDGAPLAVSVRQDHRATLGIQRSKNDICFSPTAGGEYPVRLQSLLPARDGTVRGAQIFLRVAGSGETGRAAN